MAKKITAKSIICAGIAKGQTVAAIVKSVQSKIPASKADASHIGYYANAMLKSKEIKQDVRDKYVKGKGRPAVKADKKVKKVKSEKKVKKVKSEKKVKSSKKAKAKAGKKD